MVILSALLGAFSVVLFIQAAVRLLGKKYQIGFRYWKDICISKSVLLVSILSFIISMVLILARWQSTVIARLVLLLIMLCAMAVLTVCDYKCQLVPNIVLLILTGIWIVVIAFVIFTNASIGFFLFIQGGIGAAMGAVTFGLCYILSRRQLGAGDVKLAIIMGLYLPTECSICAYLLGAVICCVFSFIQVFRKKIGWKDSMPMVPFLTIGMWLALFLVKW